MRLSALVLLGFAACASVSAQSSNLDIAITDSGNRASVEAARSAPYQGGPWAEIAAVPVSAGESPTADAFRIRTWQEAGAARVLVYAVARERQSGREVRESETQIATFLLKAGDSVAVSQTEQFNARPVTVSARAAGAQ